MFFRIEKYIKIKKICKKLSFFLFGICFITSHLLTLSNYGYVFVSKVAFRYAADIWVCNMNISVCNINISVCKIISVCTHFFVCKMNIGGFQIYFSSKSRYNKQQTIKQQTRNAFWSNNFFVKIM